MISTTLPLFSIPIRQLKMDDIYQRWLILGPPVMVENCRPLSVVSSQSYQYQSISITSVNQPTLVVQDINQHR